MATEYKTVLAKLLGLKDDATDEAISNAAVTFQSEMVAWKTNTEAESETLSNRVTEAEAAKDAAEEAVKLANAKVTSLTEELVNSDMARFDAIITNKEDVKAQLIANREGTVKILNSIKAQAAPAKDAPLHNSRTAGTPAPVVDGDNQELSIDVAKKISNRAREIQATQKVSFQQAFIAARGEVAA